MFDFSFVIGIAMAIIIIILSKIILRRLRILMYKGYEMRSIRISALSFIAVLYITMLVTFFIMQI